MIDRLLAQPKRDAGEDIYLDALSDLVAAYEDEHDPIAPASDADMLRHLMQAKHVNQARLSKETGIAKSTVSEVLAGKKPFSRKIIPQAGRVFRGRRGRAFGEFVRESRCRCIHPVGCARVFKSPASN